MDSEDTIAAISTPIGEGGISIVRMSGGEAISLASRIFRGKRNPSDMPSHTIAYGWVFDPQTGSEIDEVLLTVMRAPHTYTREDVVEINCHGGLLSSKKILDLLLREGARLSQPGEFTKRAFLNGRLDISQAEAVADLIRAKTDLAHRVSLRQLEGDLHRKLSALRDEILSLLAHSEAAVDFPEEEIEILPYDEMRRISSEISRELEKLLAGADRGKLIRDGVAIAIVGRPNVGKSSLFNALLREERAIVTDIPGTTRDSIEESINLRGIQARLIDTAGLRDTQDAIEREGVARSRCSIEEADMILLVVDASQPLDGDLPDVGEKPTIVVANKIDLPLAIDIAELRRLWEVAEVSALYGIGIEELEERIAGLIWGGRVPSPDEVALTNIRHIHAIRRAREAIGRFMENLVSKVSPEFLSIDLRDALNALGEVTGETLTDDILDRIFSTFCIGK